jgi:regulator of protease activity HflC (stomatin/prohibitin superfamily)
MDSSAGSVFVAVAIIAVFAYLIVFAKGCHVIRPYQQGVVTMLGSYRQTINPGFRIVSPLATVVVVDLRPRSAVLVPFPTPTVSGQPVNVGAHVEFKVVDAARSVFQSADLTATLQRALKESLANEVAPTTLETILPSGWSIAQRTRERLVSLAAPLGVEIQRVSITVDASAGRLEFFAQ